MSTVSPVLISILSADCWQGKDLDLLMFYYCYKMLEIVDLKKWKDVARNVAQQLGGVLVAFVEDRPTW